MEDWLQKIVDDDDLGLLDVKPKNARITADERLGVDKSPRSSSFNISSIDCG